MKTTLETSEDKNYTRNELNENYTRNEWSDQKLIENILKKSIYSGEFYTRLECVSNGHESGVVGLCGLELLIQNT